MISQACEISQIKALKHNAISVNGAYEKSKADQTVNGICSYSNCSIYFESAHPQCKNLIISRMT